MSDGRSLPWLLGLAGMLLAAAGLSVVLLWIGAGWQEQVDAFYSSQSEPVDDPTYRTWDALSRNAYTLQQVAVPLMVGVSAALFALLGVVAWRWDARDG